MMRRAGYLGAVSLMLACVAGCGKISFGEDLVQGPDAGPVEDVGPIPDVPDVGPPPVDMGVIDTGEPPPDTGEPECLPVTLPPTPTDWPFGTDRAAYEGLFWTWANTQQFACSSGACHGGDEAPRIPSGANLDGEYSRGITELWPYLRDETTDYSGRLWRHHVNYDGPDGQEGPDYTPEQVQFLKDLVHASWACSAAPAIERQDAGSGCGAPEPVDAGPPPDAGDEDGGDADGGMPEAGPSPDGGGGGAYPCYCDLPDVGSLETTYCAP